MSDARIRIVHCSPDTPAVSVSLSGATTDHDPTRPIEFGENTGYLVTESGEVDIDVTPISGAGAPIVHTSHDLESDEMWTLVVMGLSNENSIRTIDLEDEPAPSEQEVAQVRFLNAIPDQNARPLGLRFDEPVVDDTYVVSREIESGQHGTYREVSPGRHRYHIGVDTGGEALESLGEQQEMDYEPLLSGEGSFDAGRAYTVIAMGHGATNDFELLVLEDTPTESTPA